MFDKRAYRKDYNKKYRSRPDRKEYHRRMVLTRYRERMELLRALKENTPCTDCGNSYPHYVMDLDHTCDVVCANCHKIRTWERSNAR